jgi:hypothetical protein
MSLSRKIIWWLGVGVILAMTTFGIYYHVTILNPEASVYNSSLQAAASKLKSASAKLADVSEKLLLEAQQPTLEEKLAHIEALTTEVQQVRGELALFRKTSEDFRVYPYSFTSSHYQKSLTYKMQSAAIVDQMDEILDEYNQLLAFLPKYFTTRQHVSDALATFNSLVDLNELANQDAELKLIAMSIQQETAILAAAPYPRGFEAIIARSTEHHERIVEGFTALATSLSPPIDADIYAAAYQLEQLSIEDSSLSNAAFDQVLLQSPILKDISSLPEVMDRLTF